MTTPGNPANADDAEDTYAETLVEIPEGSVMLRTVEIVQFLNSEGQESVAVQWRGTPGNILVELGMLEYAKAELIDIRLTNPQQDLS